MFSAAGHDYLSVPVFLGLGATGRVAVTLVPLVMPEAGESLKIVGSWNNFSRRRGQPMVRRSDGAYEWRGVSRESTVSYQLLGLGASFRGVPGTQADRFEADRWLATRAVLDVEPGEITIVFDPAQLPARITGASPKVQWRAANAFLDRVFAVDHLELAWDESETEGAADGDGNRESRKERAREFFRLRQILRDDPEPRVRAAAGGSLLRLLDCDEAADTEIRGLLDEVITTVPPESRAWAIQPSIAYTVGGLNIEDPADLVRRFYANPDRRVRAEALSRLVVDAKESGNSERWRERYAELRDGYADLPGVARTLRNVNPDPEIRPGRPAPAFELTDLDGGLLRLAELRGRWVLIDFWATWCKPCTDEMPWLHHAWEEYKERGLEIVSLSDDDVAEDVADFRRERWPMPWRHALVGRDELTVSDAYEVVGIPRPVLVRPDGTIAALDAGLRGAQLLETLRTLIGPGGG